MFFRIIILTLFLSGCTSQLWHTKPSYVERITGFYGVEDKDLLIVSGERYSYVFQANKEIKEVLALSRKIRFQPSYKGFKLNQYGSITGTFNLVTKSNQVALLKKHGFSPDYLGTMNIKFSLKGKRYTVDGKLPFTKLAGNHSVIVEIPENELTVVGKIVATPITIAIDAVTTIPAAALFALTRPLLIH